MIPDHARALRTSTVLATAAGIASFFLTVALADREEWLAFAASAFTTIALVAIGGRCAYAYDKFQLRRRQGSYWSLALIGCALASYPAAAQPPRSETLATAGVWNAFVAIGDNGTMICGMDTSWPDGRHFAVKRIGANRHLTLHVSRSTWRIPPGTRIAATMMIGSVPFVGTGTAAHDGQVIEWTLSGDEIGRFERAFRAASVMRLTFASGNEPAWTISLRGTNAMADAFLGCIDAQREIGRQRAPTQPFDAAPAAPALIPRGPERRA